MRKLLTLVLFLISLCSQVQANEQEIANSFVQFVNSIVKPIEQSYEKDTYSIIQVKPIEGIPNSPDIGKYFKSKYYNFQYSYDLKRTDSVLSPYEGILDLSCGLKTYSKWKTEEQAKADNIVIREKPVFRCNRYTYKYQNGQWIKSRVQFTDSNGILREETLKSQESSFMQRN